MDRAIVAAFSFLNILQLKCEPLDIVIINEISLIYIILTSKVTSPCPLSIPAVNSSVSATM